jgi:hypothetical protein
MAMAVALLDVPTGVGAHRRREIDATHHPRGMRRWMLGWRRCAGPYVDLVFLARAVSRLRRDGAPGNDTTIVFPPEMHRLEEDGSPLVIVFGHIAFAPLVAGLAEVRRLQRARGGTLPIATAQIAPGRLSSGQLRNALRDRLLVAGFDAIRDDEGGPGDVVIDRGRSVSSARALLRAASTPGAVSALAIDPPWDLPGTQRRPFAGWASYPVSTGAARMARHGGAGIVLAAPVARPDGGWRLEFGRVHDAQAFPSTDALSDALLDELERYIGEDPAAYLLPLGRGRTWDESGHCWRGRATR